MRVTTTTLAMLLILTSAAFARGQSDGDGTIELQISIIVSDSLEPMERALGDLERGASFAETARRYSKGPNADDGGYVGYMSTDDMRPELREVVEGLGRGEFSGVVEADGGYYIVQLGLDTRYADTPDFITDTPSPATGTGDYSRNRYPDASTPGAPPLFYVAAAILLLGGGFGIYNHRDARTPIRFADGSVATVYGKLPPGTAIQDGYLPGARIVVFEYCVSLLFFTTKRPGPAYIVGKHESTLPKAIPYIAISLLFGWWGIPFGPIYTVSTVYRNLRGGHQLDLEPRET